MCSFTYSQKDEIKALSQLYQQKGYKQCEYHIRAPRNSFIEFNFTRVFGFRLRSSMTTGSGNLQSERSKAYEDSETCLLPEVVLEEASDADQIGKICTNSHNLKSPKVFHSKFNVVKITYTWVKNHSSGFTVEFDFHHYNSKYIIIFVLCNIVQTLDYIVVIWYLISVKTTTTDIQLFFSSFCIEPFSDILDWLSDYPTGPFISYYLILETNKMQKYTKFYSEAS